MGWYIVFALSTLGVIGLRLWDWHQQREIDVLMEREMLEGIKERARRRHPSAVPALRARPLNQPLIQPEFYDQDADPAA